MNKVAKLTILALLILAAIACYAYGSATGLIVFIAVGVIFELAFWFGIFSKQSGRASL